MHKGLILGLLGCISNLECGGCPCMQSVWSDIDTWPHDRSDRSSAFTWKASHNLTVMGAMLDSVLGLNSMHGPNR